MALLTNKSRHISCLGKIRRQFALYLFVLEAVGVLVPTARAFKVGRTVATRAAAPARPSWELNSPDYRCSFAVNNRRRVRRRPKLLRPQTCVLWAAEEDTEEGKGRDTYSAKFLDDNGLQLMLDANGRVTARPQARGVVRTSGEAQKKKTARRQPSEERDDAEVIAVELEDISTLPTQINSTTTLLQEIPPEGTTITSGPQPALPIQELPTPDNTASEFNVVLTHCTADFDSLASAVGLAKLWQQEEQERCENDGVAMIRPTFVVLPRGAHPGVQRFLALHKYLFPIRSLRSLPDLSGLNRLGLVDAQRRDRLGPAEHLLGEATEVIILDHHIEADSDIPEATDFVVDQVGSVSTLVVERLQKAEMQISEAEATLLALGIHADTGSLRYEATTTRDVAALLWVMQQGASQSALAEHAKSSLSPEQQGVLTQALINTNSTKIHGVTVSTVLLGADGFINGLAAVTTDALELSTSDIFLLSLVYEARSGGSSKRSGVVKSQLLKERQQQHNALPGINSTAMAEAWMGGKDALRRRRLRAAFDRKDMDGSGYLEKNEIAAALATSGVVASDGTIDSIFDSIDSDGDGRIDFEEFVSFSEDAEKLKQDKASGRRSSTMIVIGRVRAGVNTKQVKLNRVFERYGGGGHAQAASATVRLSDESEAEGILQGLVDELIETGLLEQPTVEDFMTAPVLSVRPDMTEKQVEDLFTRYDVRALPVVDDNNDVVGLVTYKEVAAAKQRLWNKEQKRLRQEASHTKKQNTEQHETSVEAELIAKRRKNGSALKGWMKQHVQLVEASMTMAEVEALLLETDVGCIPVVADGTKQLVGMVTRTDLLRQHRYYSSLHYHNKGFSDSIAARKPIIELRRKLKQFDLEDE